MSTNSRFTGTFEYVVDNFNEIAVGQEIFSEPYTIGNLSWAIEVQKTVDESDLPFLGVFICCYDNQEESSYWRIFAKVTFSLLSQDDCSDDYSWTLKHLFQQEDGWSWGNSFFMKWDDVLEESNGYICNGEVVIRAHVEFSFPVGKESRNWTNTSTTEIPMEKMKTAKKLKEFSESQLKIDLLNEKFNTEKISEELMTKSAAFESSLGAMELKIASLQELLKTEKLETAKKLKDLGDQLEKEKLIVQAYKDMFQKILS